MFKLLTTFSLFNLMLTTYGIMEHLKDLPNNALLNRKAKKTGLILSGGGVYGAFEVGVIKALCEKEEYRNTWSLITGTSIGALNGGALAQFNQDQQCGEGLQVLLDFFQNIEDESSIYTLGSGIGVKKCFSLLNGPSLMRNFFKFGGFCDPSTGHDTYRKMVSQELIHESDIELWAPTSSLTKRSIQWWSDQSEHILDALLGSASISPAVYPVKFAGQWHVDALWYSNTPLLKALEEGAQRAIVVILRPMGHLEQIIEDGEEGSDFKEGTDVDGGDEETIDGTDILMYYREIIEDEIFVYKELTRACRNYPNAEILGYFPSKDLGNILDWKQDNIVRIINEGYNDGLQEPVDLCAFLGLDQITDLSPEHENIWILASVGFGIVLSNIIRLIVGCIIPVFSNKKKKTVVLEEEKKALSSSSSTSGSRRSSTTNSINGRNINSPSPFKRKSMINRSFNSHCSLPELDGSGGSSPKERQALEMESSQENLRNLLGYETD
jgi:predicted acylesterase/phospholipase RssA